MRDIPFDGFIRVNEVLKFIPWSRSTLYNKVRSGEFPQPVKLSANTSAFRAADIRKWVDEKSADSAKAA